ncbi:rhamnan synthesis F family protein [Legionella sp. D16C41]|uniref:rhamnan synthesis F family protein n=1 Tax=Legionella sp. D16C41 TaxID=3402688 RepID=UPI003AF43B64
MDSVDKDKQARTIQPATINNLDNFRQLLIKTSNNNSSHEECRIETVSMNTFNLEKVDLIKANTEKTAALTQNKLNYQQLLDERDEQIKNYIKEIKKLELQSNEMSEEIQNIYLSNSWRITKPLRFLSQKKSQLINFIYSYLKYILQFKSISADKIIPELETQTIASEEISNLLLLLDATENDKVFLPHYLGVHIYVNNNSEQLAEMALYLKNIPIPFSLYITTDSNSSVKLIKEVFSNINDYCKLEEIIVFQPIEGELFSMFSAFKDKLNQHDIILHLQTHTKSFISSLWTLEINGWWRYLMESLLGDEKYINTILQQFIQDEKLGVIFPQPYKEIKDYVSKKENLYLQKFSSILNKDNIHKSLSFFGGMFWFRSELIEQVSQTSLPIEKTEVTELLSNSRVTHEEIFPFIADQCGMQAKPYSLTSFLSPESHAHQFNLFRIYLKRKLIKNAIIFFDHNLGGGTNIYTRAFIKEAFEKNFSIIRIYNFQGIWFLQWLANNDAMLFYTKYFEELFNNLEFIPATSIVVNSLYGFPQVAESIKNIIALTKKINAPIEIKMHDYFTLCPSPHLVNMSGQYCEVPQDATICSQCLKGNLSWYPAWYPRKEQPKDIINWRQPFLDLLAAASILTFFDQASVDIFRRAFHIESQKIRIVPHEIDYFVWNKPIALEGPLHIGILGTLNSIKGSSIVQELGHYISTNHLSTKITVVGPSVELLPEITIYGPYEPNQLPSIIEKNKINVVLVPSIVPETFGYTISEAIKMKLPIVAFDLGAQGNRVKHYKWGKVIPLGSSAETILQAAETVLKLAKGSI